MTSSLTIYNVPEATAQTEAQPGYSRNPCRVCGASCCQQPVPFSVVEALRMAAQLGRPIESFAGPNYTSHRIHNAWPFKLEGGWARFEFHTPGYRCVHAGEAVNGQLRCGAWEARPGACRVFPFSVSFGGEDFFVGGERWCPERWLQDDTLRASIAQACATWQDDLRTDKRVVMRWNRGRRRDRSLRAFLHYLYTQVAGELGFDCARFAESLPDPPDSSRP